MDEKEKAFHSSYAHFYWTKIWKKDYQQDEHKIPLSSRGGEIIFQEFLLTSDTTKRAKISIFYELVSNLLTVELVLIEGHKVLKRCFLPVIDHGKPSSPWETDDTTLEWRQ